VRDLVKIERAELVSKFDDQVRPKLAALAENNPTATHIVVFQNLDMWSSQFGKVSAVAVGPGCTVESLEVAAKSHLGDLPSQRQYAVSYYVVERSADNAANR